MVINNNTSITSTNKNNKNTDNRDAVWAPPPPPFRNNNNKVISALSYSNNNHLGLKGFRGNLPQRAGVESNPLAAGSNTLSARFRHEPSNSNRKATADAVLDASRTNYHLIACW